VLARMPRSPSVRQIIKGKRIWKVAAMALTHRMYEIGLSSEWHYRMNCVELGRLGYRSSEPDGIQRETSQALSKVLQALRAERVGLSEICGDLNVHVEELSRLLLGLTLTQIEGDANGGDRKRPDLQVVQGY
jgi:hypothetical protein